ncbi:MAG: flagellar basal body P-ring formation chaperone FlgA [Phycisphaerales bacterium]
MISPAFTTHAQRTIICMVMLVSWLAHAGVTTVTLKPTVRISGDEPITLGQLCAIEGDQRDLLDAVVLDGVLVDGKGGWLKLPAQELRSLLESDEDIHAGAVIIEGLEVSVRRMGTQRTVTSTAPMLRAQEKAEAVKNQGPVIKSHIERWVHDRYRVGTDPVRIKFRDLDEDFLSTATSGNLLEIKELSKRGRTAIRVVLMNEFEILAEKALIFDVEIQREVLFARTRLNRGTVLDESHLMSELRWINPEEKSATHEMALGMSVTKIVESGELLSEDHIEKPVVIRRGELVSAKSISGSVVVTVRGRALADARLGAVVEIESMNGETSFVARAIGEGRAIILKKGQEGNMQ